MYRESNLWTVKLESISYITYGEILMLSVH